MSSFPASGTPAVRTAVFAAIVLLSAPDLAGVEGNAGPPRVPVVNVPGEVWHDAPVEAAGKAPAESIDTKRKSGDLRQAKPRPASIKLKAGGAWPYPLIELPPVSDAEREAERQRAEASTRFLAHPVGFGRDVPGRYAERVSADDLYWDPAAHGGQVSVLGLRSPGAQALRVLLSIDALPEGAELRFYNPENPDGAVGPIGADEALADRVGEGAALYWSPIVAGDAVAIEIYLPPQAQSEGLKLGVPLISHLDADPTRITATGIGRSGYCQVDVACAAEAVSEPVRASVAKYLFTVAGGRTGACSGTLLSDADPDSQIPFFLTADHCVENQREASTMIFHWFFERQGCDGAAPESVITTGGGATVLSSGRIAEHDYVFARLNQPPAAGAGLSGWTTATFPESYRVFGVHHPRGDLKKFSRASIVGYRNWPNLEEVYPSHIKVNYDYQAMQGGSSGSGLWAPVGDSQYLIGVLTGGLLDIVGTGCPDFFTPQLTGYFGRFDRVYERARPWLGPVDFAVVPEERISASLVATLVDLDGAHVADLADGRTVDLSGSSATAFDVRLDNVDAADIASVRFSLSGPAPANRISNATPHRLYGDGGGGALPSGEYRLRVTPYSGFFGNGSTRAGLDFRFTVTGGSTSAASLTGFDLIDPVAETVVQTVATGASLTVAGLSTNRLNIRAGSAGGTAAGSVAFLLTSPPDADTPTLSESRTDNAAPFTLYGDRGRGAILPAGSYRLTATPYPEDNKGGTAGTALSVDFTVVEADTSPVESLALIDGEDDEAILTLTEGARLTSRNRPDHFNITANLREGQEVDSVALTLAGPLTIGRTEFTGPFSLLGDDNGDLRARRLRFGTFRVTAIPQVRGQPARGLSRWFAVDKTIFEQPGRDTIDRVELITRDGGATTIADGDVLDLTGLHGDVNIRAVPLTFSISTASLALSGGGRTLTRLDNSRPFTLLPNYGDLPNGEHELIVTAFRTDNDKTQLFGTKTVRFTVTGAPEDAALVESPVTGFSLVEIANEAVTSTRALHDGDEIETTGGPTRAYGITAQVDAGAGVGALLMELLHTDANQSSDLTWRLVEAPGPYSLFGVQDGVLADRALEPGTYRLSATAYRSNELTGGWPRRFVDFAVVLLPAYDSSLSVLDLSDISMGAFDPRRTDYNADAADNVAMTTVTATAAQNGANVSITPADASTDTGHQVSLAFGPPKDITVTVTSPNGLRTTVYTVSVDRLSDDASLSALSLTDIDIGTFAPDTTEYTGTAAFDLETTTVTATASYGEASVSIGPPDARPGESGHQVALSYGERTTVSVRVTAESGAEQAYAVHVERPPLSDERITLDALSVSEIDIGTFSKFQLEYEGEGSLGQALTTVTATPSDSDASVDIQPGDADPDTEGIQVALDTDPDVDGIQAPSASEAGSASIAVTVTASDGNGDSATYRVEVHSVTDGRLRLVDGEAPDQGRLEVWHDGRWGTVCDDRWKFNGNNAVVACRQLGYAGAIDHNSAYDLRSGKFHFPSSDGEHWLDDLECRGEEARLVDCPHSDWGDHNCFSLEAVGVWCDPSPPVHVAIEADPDPVSEGETATFTLTRDGLADDALQVKVRVAESGAMIDGTPPETVDFAPLQNDAVLSVPTVNDTQAEAASVITAEVVIGNRYEPMTPSTALRTVQDDADLAALSRLALSGVDFGRFASETLSYAATVDAGTASTTVSANANDSGSTVSILPADADGQTERHEVDLPAGETTEITVTVTASDSTVRVYTVAVTRPFPPAEIAIEAAADAALEGTNFDAVFTLRRTVETRGALTVAVAVTEVGRYIDGAAPTTVEFGAGAALAELRVPIENDAVIEADGAVTATVGAGTGYVVGAAATATVQLTNDDAASFGLTADRSVLTEANAGSATLTVDTGGNVFDSIQTINFVHSGSAEAGRDYRLSPQPLTLDAGARSATAALTVLDDDVDDDAESIEIDGSHGGDPFGDPFSIEIVDDDTRGVSPSETALTVPEGGSGSFTVHLESAPTVRVTVMVTLSPANPDIVVSPLSLRFDANNWNVSRGVTVTGREDNDALTDRTMLQFSVRGGDYEAETVAGVDVTVTDNDFPVLAVADTQAAEDAGTISFAVTLDPAAEVAVTVGYATADGTADAGSDYSGTSGTLTIDAGDTSATIEVPILDDADLEPAETFSLTLSGASAPATLTGGRSAATGTIPANDLPQVTVSFGQANYTASEGASATVTVRLNEAPQRDVAIPLTAEDASGATDADWSGAPPRLEFGPLETEKSFAVTAAADAVDDDNEAVSLGFGTLPEGVSAGAIPGATVTIGDDDTRGVAVSAQSLAVPEGDAATYTVRLESEPTDRVTVTVSENPASDDIGVSPATLQFTSGNWDRPVPVGVTAREDTDALTDATTLEHAVSGGDYEGTAASDVAVTVVENEASVLSIDDVRAREDTGTLTFTVRLSLAAGSEATADYQTVDGTASAGSDYVAASGTVRIPAGQTTAEIAVTLTDDGDDEDDETFEVRLSDASVATLAGGRSAATVTIEDDDAPEVSVSFEAADYAVSEGDSVRVTVRLDGAPERSLEIPLTAQGADGATGSDWSGVPAQLAFGAADTERRFTVTAVNDPEDDDGEAVALGFGALPERVRLGATPTATIALGDDDHPYLDARFAAADATASEGGAGASVTLSLSAPPERALEIPVVVRGTDGARPADWSVPERLAFGASDTERSFTVNAVDDAVDDDGEGMEIAFGRLPERVSEGMPAQVAVALEDDDERGVAVSEQSLDVPEGGAATYTVRLESAPTARVTITVEERPPSSDIRVNPASLRFDADDWHAPRAVTVEAAEDSDALTDETTLEHRVRGGDYEGEPADSVDVAVTENETPVLTIADARAAEGGTLIFPVGLSLAAATDVLVDYTTADGTAVSRTDYEGAVGTLALVAGALSGEIAVAALDDAENEADETFTVRLSGALGATLAGGGATATGTIEDDDGPPGPPRALAARANGTDRIDLSWQAPENGGDTPIVAYRIEWSPDGSTGWFELVDNTGATDTRHNDRSGLDPGETRHYRVSAINGAGAGAVSEVAGATTATTGGGGSGGGGSGGGGGGGGAANIPPVVEREVGPQTLAAGDVLELDITLHFYDRNQRALDYSVVSSNTAVATVAVSRQGVLTIRGVARGVAVVTLTAADRRDERVSQTFVVTVTGPALAPLFLAASDASGRQGFLRVINRSGEAGEVTIAAIDDAGEQRGSLTLAMGANETAHFNSNDLERGNADKGLTGEVEAGAGDWRLVLESELEFEVLSYIRTADGFLTSMHDLAPGDGHSHRVAIFNPGSNPNQVSGLRLVNPGTEDAEVTIAGVDDAGASPGSAVVLTVPAGASRTILAANLENGGEGLSGALGDGTGKWRLTVDSDQSIAVMSLLSSPTGHLTNLSTVPDRGEL